MSGGRAAPSIARAMNVFIEAHDCLHFKDNKIYCNDIYLYH